MTEDGGSPLEGNRLADVPRNAASLWTSYEIQSSDLQDLGFGVGLFFANVLALGVEPVEFAISPDWLEKREYLRDRVSGIESVGDHTQPSIEKILTLNPDLILGLELESQAVYRQLTQIAPTVLLNCETSRQWQEILMQNADVLGKTDIANKLITDYFNRLNDFKTQSQSSSHRSESHHRSHSVEGCFNCSTNAACSGDRNPFCTTVSTVAISPSSSDKTANHRPGNTLLWMMPSSGSCRIYSSSCSTNQSNFWSSTCQTIYS
ncbi:hypothetical protein NIES1031_12095 [Chroogloeocystis siderophila 5.2 s.c.1]|uniref:Fe/B12 periplasmic-binding domain-containing protein n=1 Tax=Chroogloeocystis siderophila 5.2 s.c.1 TaxID=247279 RepID=A0A1U7HQA7_9CHRO|nr:hypothetical protein NIES1031_12095 [Chroogloeocystis siderophila 5.2 s.c.1]